MPLSKDPMVNSDDFYAALLRAHEGLDEAETHALNARLILLLANHINDLDTLNEALTIARGSELSASAVFKDPTKS